MRDILFVAAGGAAGAVMRFGLGLWAVRAIGPAFPWGTLIANLAGGLLMGLLAGAVLRAGSGTPVHLLLGVGLLGGFTTFSAFSLEAAMMIERGDMLLALSYSLASVVGAVLLLFAGLWLGRSVA